MTTSSTLMDYILNDLKNKQWDTAHNVPTVRCGLTISDSSYVQLTIYVFPSALVNNCFDLSLLTLIMYPNIKSSMFEMEFDDFNMLKRPDILVGFVPHPDAKATDLTCVTVLIEPQNRPKKGWFWSTPAIDKSEWWTSEIKNNTAYTPFLYDKFPFPTMSFINWNITLKCNSLVKPRILCANVQQKERVALVNANIYMPHCKYTLFPNFNKFRMQNDLVLPNI